MQKTTSNMRKGTIAAKLLFSMAGSAIIAWQMLLPGYVMTLDMVFGPESLGGFAGSLISAWIVQKIFLLALFFLLLFLPAYFFRRILDLRSGDKSYGAEYVAALYFAFNPFVYERFLAGQWLLVFGYAFLFPAAAYLIDFCRHKRGADALRLAVAACVIGMLSPHVFVMFACVAAVTFAGKLICSGFDLRFLKIAVSVTFATSVALGLSTHLTLPGRIDQDLMNLEAFDSTHWTAFAPVSDQGKIPLAESVLLNIATLRGFWLESMPWSEGFNINPSSDRLYLLTLIPFLLLVIVGAYMGMRNKLIRGLSVSIAIAILVAIALSSGAADTPFQAMNYWLYDHVFVWRGFRDSQKWSAVIAACYSFFAGIGSYLIISGIKERFGEWAIKNIGHAAFARAITVCLLVLTAVPLVHTPMMLFGFSGQLNAIRYPKSWEHANAILEQTPDCKAVFLPWHLYYSLSFNNYRLTANASQKYFKCKVIHSENMELGEGVTRKIMGNEYSSLEKAVTSSSSTGEDVNSNVETLRNLGVDFIIFTDDVAGEDRYKYPLLNSRALEKVMNNEGLILYRIL